MAIIDAKLDFCDATSLNTGAAGGYLLGNIIDLGANGIRDIGNGTPVYLVIQVHTTATSGGSATGQFQLYQGTGNDGTEINAGLEALLATQAYPVAEMVAGKILWCASLPSEGDTYKRYLQIRQITGTAAFTAGKINAYLCLTPPTWKAAADALTV